MFKHCSPKLPLIKLWALIGGGNNMKNVRIIAAVMAVSMAGSVFTGCLNRNTTPWQDEARTLVADKMDDTNVGKFVIDGVKYDFPMPVKDLTDAGWNFSSESVGTTQMQPYTWHANYITLKNAQNKSIEIAVYNSTDAVSTIAEATVGEVRVSSLRGNAMLSGGIEFYATEFEDYGKLGEHGASGFELDLSEGIGTSDNVYTKTFKGSNGKNCTATFYFGDDSNGKIVLKEIKYECAFKIPYVDAATGIILAVTKNDPSKVEELDSTTDGKEFVGEARKSLADNFVTALGFELEELTDEQYAKVYEILDAIYAKTTFTVQDKGFNTLVVFNAPTNLAEVMSSAISNASDEYDGEDFSDPDFLDLVLGYFSVDDLEFMPANDVLITNDSFFDGVYTVLLSMLGFGE